MSTRVRAKRSSDEEPKRSNSGRGVEPRQNGSVRTTEPRRNNSNRETPKRGIGRNKSLPTGQKRRPSLEGLEDASKQRRPVRRPVPDSSKAATGDAARKGRKAPAARGINVSRSMGADQISRPRKPASESSLQAGGSPKVMRGRKVAGSSATGGGGGAASRARSTSRPRPDAPRARSRSADASANALRGQKPRKTESGDAVPAAPLRKARRAPDKRGIGSNKSDVAMNPAHASPSSGRKPRRAPEKRGIAPAKSLPSEQIRRVEQTRREAGSANAKKTGRARSEVLDDSSSEESSSEESSSSESSVEPTETSYGDEMDSDEESDDTSFDEVLSESDLLDNNYEEDPYAYTNTVKAGFDDGISFGPAPKLGGRVVYPGGIVVEDASDSETEFEHLLPSRNRRPDLEGGELPIEPVTFGRAAAHKRTAAASRAKSPKADARKSPKGESRNSPKGDARQSNSSSGSRRQDNHRSGSSGDGAPRSSRNSNPKRSSSDGKRERDRERRKHAVSPKGFSDHNRRPVSNASARRSNSAERLHSEDRRAARDRSGTAPRKPPIRHRSTSSDQMFGLEDNRRPARRSVSAERIRIRGNDKGPSHSKSSSSRPGVNRTSSAEKLRAYVGEKAKTVADKARKRSGSIERLFHRGDDPKSKSSGSDHGTRTTRNRGRSEDFTFDDDDDGVRVTPAKPSSMKVKQAYPVQAKPVRRPGNGSRGAY